MNFFNQLLKARNPFIKNVSFLSFGTLISQLLLISAIPLLTRLYSPSDFGLLAICLALTQFLGVYLVNIAIPLSKDKRESSYLSLFNFECMYLSLSASAVILFFDNQLITLLGNTEFKQFILYPLSMFFIGLYESLQYYVTKLGYFKLIASTRITRALLSIAFQLSYAFLYEPDAFGLIIGQIIYFASGS